MTQQSYTSAYAVAMDAATAQLDGLFEEAARLRERMEKINSVIEALKPLFPEFDSQEVNSELNVTKQPAGAEMDLVLV